MKLDLKCPRSMALARRPSAMAKNATKCSTRDYSKLSALSMHITNYGSAPSNFYAMRSNLVELLLRNRFSDGQVTRNSVSLLFIS
jgi:hypothetical protein